MTESTDPEPIAAIAQRIADATGGFTGGGIELFESVGRFTMDSMVQAGLRPEHRVLDLGCGALRVGYWLVRYLNPERYFGLERSAKYVEIGVKYAIGPELEAQKRPRFHIAKNFDFSPFGVRFDFVVARSIFSHASLRQIRLAMESFRGNSTPGAIMLASYLRSKKPGNVGIESLTDSQEWMLRRYSLELLQDEARQRQLVADDFGEPFNHQTWLRITRSEDV